MTERMKEPCPQQKTGSCYGCPVMSGIYDVARNAANWRPSQLEPEISQAAGKATSEQCPEGLSPQTKLIGVRDYGKDLGGRTVRVYLKDSR